MSSNPDDEIIKVAAKFYKFLYDPARVQTGQT